MIIESRYGVFFEDTFSYTRKENNAYEKRIHETAFRNKGSSEPIIYTKVELRRSKRSRVSKSFSSNFIAYALESKPQIFKEVTSMLEAQI